MEKIKEESEGSMNEEYNIAEELHQFHLALDPVRERITSIFRELNMVLRMLSLLSSDDIF